MNYINLGKSGLRVSRICLGCMSYSVTPTKERPWTLDEEHGRPGERLRELVVRHYETRTAGPGWKFAATSS